MKQTSSVGKRDGGVALFSAIHSGLQVLCYARGLAMTHEAASAQSQTTVSATSSGFSIRPTGSWASIRAVRSEFSIIRQLTSGNEEGNAMSGTRPRSLALVHCLTSACVECIHGF